MPWQPLGLIFPDIELVLTGRFRAALTDRPEPFAEDVYVGNTRPSAEAWKRAYPSDPYPSRLLGIRRDGGTQAEMRDRPRVTLLVWANSEKDADDLARLVMALAPTFVDGSPIVAVPLSGRSGPYPVADESPQFLRQSSVEFHTRGVPL